MKKSRFLIFLGLLLSSCANNVIYFDIKEQSIKSLHSRDLTNVYIKSDSLKVFYHINWGDSTDTAPDRINLRDLNKGYKVYKDWNEKRIDVTSIKLSPFSKYLIANSQGDASTFEITVKTNENGEVNWTSDNGN